MKRALSLLLLLLVAATPAAAAFNKSANVSGAVPPGGGEGVPVLLYDQTSNAAGNGAPDQDFEAAFNAYDSQGADDFVVTDPNGWDVEQVNTVGTTGTAGGSTVSVTFHSNSAGGGDPDLPGAAVAGCSYSGIVPVDTLGSLAITLPTACSLPQGTYWVAIQVNQNFGTNGQHFWSNRTVQSGSESVWRNPGNGFATGCVAYTPQTTCGVGGGASPDFLFQILGQVGQPQADLQILKTGLAPSPGTAEYTITVTNNGPSPATGVVVTDTLPAELAYVSDDCGGSNNPPWTWNIGNLGAAASVSCTISLNVVTAGAVVNTATVTGNETDPTPGNDSSQATIVVELGQSVLEIPTLGQYGILALLALLATTALLRLRRRA